MTEDTSPEKIEKLVEEFKESCEDPYDDLASMVFPSATQELIKIGEPAVKYLIEALKTEHKVSEYSMGEGSEDCREYPPYEDWIRQEAAMALGKIGDVRAVPHLIELLEYVPYIDGGDYGDCYWDVALAGVIALGQIGDARAVKPLLELAPDEGSPSRWMIEKLLGTEKNITGLGHFISVQVNREIARALGDIGLENDDMEIVTLGIDELYTYIEQHPIQLPWPHHEAEPISYAELGIDRDADVADVLGNICNSVKLRFAESTLNPTAAEAFDMLTDISVSLLAGKVQFLARHSGLGDDKEITDSLAEGILYDVIHAAREAVGKLGHEIK